MKAEVDEQSLWMSASQAQAAEYHVPLIECQALSAIGMANQRNTRLQIVAQMSRLLSKLGETPASMEANYGIDHRHIGRFRDDTWAVTSRRELQILMSLANEGTDSFPFLNLQPDQVWETFTEVPPAACFVSKKGTEPRIEDVNAYTRLHRGVAIDWPMTTGDVLRTIAERNCVIIGSPKHNANCESALRELFNVQSAAPAPFTLVWNDWRSLEKQSAFCDQAGPSGVGLRVRLPPPPTTRKRSAASRVERSRRDNLMLHAQLADKTTSESGWDFGLFVLCRRPFDTKQEVTTVVLCGLSGWSTSEVAHDLSQGLLFLHRKHIQYGEPIWRILACPWRREGSIIHPVSTGRRWIDPSDVKALGRLAVESTSAPKVMKRS